MDRKSNEKRYIENKPIPKGQLFIFDFKIIKIRQQLLQSRQ